MDDEQGRADAEPLRYVPPRTGLRQTRVGAVALALLGGGVASIAAACAVPVVPYDSRELRMPIFGGLLAAAVTVVGLLAVRKGRWWVTPWFAVGMLPVGWLVWILRNGMC